MRPAEDSESDGRPEVLRSHSSRIFGTMSVLAGVWIIFRAGAIPFGEILTGVVLLVAGGTLIPRTRAFAAAATGRELSSRSIAVVIVVAFVVTTGANAADTSEPQETGYSSDWVDGGSVIHYDGPPATTDTPTPTDERTPTRPAAVDADGNAPR